MISTGTCRISGISFISALMNSPIPCPTCFKGSVTKVVKVIANAWRSTKGSRVLGRVTKKHKEYLWIWLLPLLVEPAKQGLLAEFHSTSDMDRPEMSTVF